MTKEAGFETSGALGAPPNIAASDWVVMKFGGTSVSSAERWRNDPNPQRYLSQRTLEVETEELGPEELIREALMLGLRTQEGVDLADTERRQRLCHAGDLVVERTVTETAAHLLFAAEDDRVTIVTPAQQVLGEVQTRSWKPLCPRHFWVHEYRVVGL